MIKLFEDRHVLAQLGQPIGTSRWIDVPQQRITDFGHITEDPDLMHIDPAWAAEHSPYGKTIAFGFLTVSLLTRMANDVIQRPGDEVSTLNYGFDRLRLLSPVMVARACAVLCHSASMAVKIFLRRRASDTNSE